MNIQTKENEKIISASLLRLRMKSPFFATLALFARFVPTKSLPTAATDGKDIFFNPNFLSSLSSPQQDALILHEVLHAALLHVLRRGVRDSKLWNIAADIVVNGMIAAQGCFELPPNPIRDQKLEHLSVEEIYELLLQEEKCDHNLSNPDLLNNPPSDDNSEGNGSQNNHQQLQEDNATDGDHKNSSSANSQCEEEGNGNGQSGEKSCQNGDNTTSNSENSYSDIESNLDSLSEAKKAQL